MRWFKTNFFTIVMVVFLKNCIYEVSSDAVFELQLQNFLNLNGEDVDGNCCSGYKDSVGRCSEKCLTKFRVCLNVYQEEIDLRSPCTFGEVMTPVLGDNNVDFNVIKDYYQPLRFELDAWQGTFSMIIEAWHEMDNATSYYTGPVLVSRMKMQKWLQVNTTWAQDVHLTGHTELNFKYRVVCQEHYHGEGCRKMCSPRSDTFGHYTCNDDGNRVCLPGWQDPSAYCSVSICSTGCKGTCKNPNECICMRGWTGPKCDQCVVYPGCAHGTCNKAFQCNCREGWGGLLCKQDLNYCTNHQPCKNGATCFNTSPGSYSCKCTPGFNGTNCEILNDSCSNDPCRNGGTCFDTGDEGFVCQCRSDFTGRYCELSAQSCSDRPCRNGALCTDSPTGFQCHCREGYEGLICEQSVNDCASSPCANGGSCLDEVNDFKCICRLGWTGKRCEGKILPKVSPCDNNPCENGGICKEAPELSVGYRCRCPPGVLGPRCTILHNQSQVQAALEEDRPMSTAQIVLIVLFSIAVPLLAIGSIVVIICMRRKRRRESCRHDDEVRRQNEQNAVHNAVNNKNLARGMIFNSLDYPHKPLNIDTPTPTFQGKDDPEKAPFKKNYTVENTYSIVPARSTKTLNTDVSRNSLASRLEKELEPFTNTNSPVDPALYQGVNLSKTPEPHMNRGHSHSDVYLKSNVNHNPSVHTSCGSTHDVRTTSAHTLTSTCTTPSSVYIIDEHVDDNYIATEV